MNTSLTGRVEGSGSSGLPNSIYLSYDSMVRCSPPPEHILLRRLPKRLGGS